MVFPFEPLAALGEEDDLPRDQLVERRPLDPAQVAIEDPPLPSPAGEAQKRAVALDGLARRQALGDPRTHLRVVRDEELVGERARHRASVAAGASARPAPALSYAERSRSKNERYRVRATRSSSVETSSP